MMADLCQLQFVVFLFCQGEKTTRRQNDNYRLFALKRRQNDKMTKRMSRLDDKIKAKRRETQSAN
jgi:hypothetical protein